MARPKTQAPAARPTPITDAVLAAIADSGLSHHALAQASGVPASAIQRFAVDGADLKLTTLDRLAGPLGLALVKPAARGRKPPRRG